MIGLGTNILLRAVLGDDAKQSPAALNFLLQLTDEEPGLVNDVTLAEFVWTPETSADYSRCEIAQALRAMMSSPCYRFLDRSSVSKAVTRFETEKRVGFADTLIGEINHAAGCSTTYSFDSGATKKTDLFTLLKP